ncbi:MAG: diguanylate cyclase [Spirochaetia bacterium]|nr:diguanylate cyclase [Spirochaetia bacterium]
MKSAIFTFAGREFADPGLENEYLRLSSHERNALLRKNLVTAIWITLIFCITDFFSFKTAVFFEAALFRLILAFICMSGLLIMKYFQNPRQLQNLLFLFSFLYTTISAIMFHYIPYPTYSFIITGMLIVMALSIFLSQRFSLCIASSVYTSFAFLLPLIIYNNASIHFISEAVTYLLAANVFGWVTFRELNKNKRVHFLTHKKEQESIANLQSEIVHRKNLEKKLKDQVSRDYLTGLYNRRFFYETIPVEISRSRRGKMPLSLIMFDMDHFKIINDTFGHLRGDEALKKVAKAVLRNLRAEDVFARVGGEEFAILCPNLDIKKAALLAERIRKNIENIRLSFKSGLAASFGIIDIKKNENVDKIMHLVDRAMYSAKKAGRNCTYEISMDGKVRKVL